MRILVPFHFKLAPATATLAGLLLICYSAFLKGQELPDLGLALRLDGTVSSAQFRAGATANGKTGFTSQVLSQDTLTLRAEVLVEPAHIGRNGNLYIVVALGDRYFMRNAQGAYVEWDTRLQSLVPTVADRALQMTEPLAILDAVQVGDLWLAGNTLSFFFAYDLATAPGELIYASTPYNLTIAPYQPLQNTRPASRVLDTAFVDNSRQREIPLLIYLPDTTLPRPVILFSHGLGGDRFAAEYLGRHWSERGYVVVFMQHPGSDSSLLEGVPPVLARFVLSLAASASNLVARIEDVSAVIDQLEGWNEESGNELYHRFDLQRIGMSGHSFGARTTQAVSGEELSWINPEPRDPRIKAAMPLSPSSPTGADPAQLYAAVDIPWMLMTGTLDVAAIGATTVEDRLAVYPALPPGGKYELVLFEAEHHAFTDRPVSLLQNPRNPAHHPEIMALGTAFWDAWLLGFGDARRWLEGAGAESVLQPLDRWQFK